jgi:hypothetical protein
LDDPTSCVSRYSFKNHGDRFPGKWACHSLSSTTKVLPFLHLCYVWGQI